MNRTPLNYADATRYRLPIRPAERQWSWPRDKAEDDPSWTSGHDEREGLRRAV